MAEAYTCPYSAGMNGGMHVDTLEVIVHTQYLVWCLVSAGLITMTFYLLDQVEML